MGYSTCMSGHFSCDSCGDCRCTNADTRKLRCPYGSCPASYFCKSCRIKYADKIGKKAHREYGCEAAHIRCENERDLEFKLQCAGYHTRCSALDIGDDTVHVLFRGVAGKTVGRYMETAVYHAIPIMDITTIEDYERKAEDMKLTINVAPGEFQNGSTTKQVGRVQI